MKISEKFINELSNKEYRDAFVSAHIDNGIPFQIRALRKKEGWTQKELADRLGMKQERISALENPNYSKFTLTTLKKIASAFDVALIVRFAPISELVQWELTLSPEKLETVSFDKDPYFQPSVLDIVGQGGLVLGGEGIMSIYYPETKPEAKPKAKVFDLNDVRQKAAGNKMDGHQKEMDMPLYNSMAAGTRQ
ncbi:MAG: helix-turn-helix domain-containing protein [Syntrophobacterales bacterium]|jgi:transcriptional regulator with XRE-family HTH domain|nr:helix-turn-helix domain-containing protein [Syntrophobacterales bacterium]